MVAVRLLVVVKDDEKVPEIDFEIVGVAVVDFVRDVVTEFVLVDERESDFDFVKENVPVRDLDLDSENVLERVGV